MKKKYYILVLTFLCILCGQASYAFTDGEEYFEDWSWSDYNHDGMPDGPIDLDGVTVNSPHGGPQCYSCDCNSFFCPGGDPNNLSDPDPEPVPEPGDGSSGGTPEVSDPEITNEITNPCLKSAVDRVINGNASNPFTTILKGDFYKQEYQSLTFITYYDNSVGGIKKDGMIEGNPANSILQLNLAALENASQEFITATIYHEIIHAYLISIKVYSEDGQHELMAESAWRDKISNQLQIDYPSLSKEDADALAWGGLGSTSQWQTMVNNDNVNNTGVTGDIAAVNKNHKNLNNSTNGNYGTTCSN